MEIGLSVTSGHPPRYEAREVARWMIERAIAIREAGFASFSLGDHHGMTAHYLQNVPLLARVLPELGDLPVYPLFLLPLWHPVLLAEQVGSLAAIHTGPVHVILAVGDGPEQFAALGVPMKERRTRMEEGIAILRRLWANDHVDYEGNHWTLHDVSVNPKPMTAPEIWIGASARVELDRAARLGDAWLGAPGLTPEEASAQMQHYREALAKHGQRATVFPIRRDVYIGESDAEAQETAGPIVERGYRGFDRSATIVGGPETAIAALKDLETRGYNHVLLRYLPVGQEKILASIRRVGRDVIPALR